MLLLERLFKDWFRKLKREATIEEAYYSGAIVMYYMCEEYMGHKKHCKSGPCVCGIGKFKAIIERNERLRVK